MSLFQRSINTGKTSIGLFPILLVFILVGTIALQIYNRIPTSPNVSLLLKTSDMIELGRFEDIATYTQTPVSLPEKLFGSSLYTVGIYPTPVNAWPAQTVSLVFIKNNARFATMEVFPNTSLEKIKNQYTTYPQETVAINDVTNGLFIRLRNGFECTLPKSDSAPSMCLITTILLFEKNGTLIQLSMDGNHITEGELIEMARSIK